MVTPPRPAPIVMAPVDCNMRVIRLNLSTVNRTLTFFLLLVTVGASLCFLRLCFKYEQSCNENNFVQTSFSNASFLRQNLAGTIFGRVRGFGVVPPAETSDLGRFSHPRYDAVKDYQTKVVEQRRRFSCTKLFEDDRMEQDKAAVYTTLHRSTFQTFPGATVPKMVADCGAFKAIRGYRAHRGGPEEQGFPLAYIILVHSDFEHLERLLRALYMPQHSFCIHVDAKAPEHLKSATAALAECFENVALASEPQTIIYAHMSRLMADIVCMKDLLDLDSSWKYLINYAATEFPLRTNLETVKILHSLQGRNDIHESFKARVKDRYKWQYEVINGKMKATSVTLAPAPHNITITKGQAYNAYSRQFVEWALTDPKPRDLLKWSEKTYSPDEHYWGTLNNLFHNGFLNSPGGFEDDPDKKGYITKFISWQYSNPRYKCHGKVVHNICVFSSRDLPTLLNQMHLGANKFDLTSDPIAYSCMEELLENKTRADVPFNLAYYKNLHFVHYTKPDVI
ncbi:unnamed protein product [Lymnaea stagnalis]|uniref:Protein xylosyltransferase n=1 Tax=Lymnaea stagnalis TaxID=6523 RepID=A0AAV2HUB6_LYMST